MQTLTFLPSVLIDFPNSSHEIHSYNPFRGEWIKTKREERWVNTKIKPFGPTSFLYLNQVQNQIMVSDEFNSKLDFCVFSSAPFGRDSSGATQRVEASLARGVKEEGFRIYDFCIISKESLDNVKIAVLADNKNESKNHGDYIILIEFNFLKQKVLTTSICSLDLSSRPMKRLCIGVTISYLGSCDYDYFQIGEPGDCFYIIQNGEDKSKFAYSEEFGQACKFEESKDADFAVLHCNGKIQVGGGGTSIQGARKLGNFHRESLTSFNSDTLVRVIKPLTGNRTIEIAEFENNSDMKLLQTLEVPSYPIAIGKSHFGFISETEKKIKILGKVGKKYQLHSVISTKFDDYFMPEILPFPQWPGLTKVFQKEFDKFVSLLPQDLSNETLSFLVE
jgi:hypothetical protein